MYTYFCVHIDKFKKLIYNEVIQTLSEEIMKEIETLKATVRKQKSIIAKLQGTKSATKATVKKTTKATAKKCASVFDKFTSGIDKKFGEDSPYYFGEDFNDYDFEKSSKRYFTKFAQDMAKSLEKFNVINIRSFKIDGVGKITTIKVTANVKSEVTEIVKSVKSFCVSKKLKNIKNSESLGVIEYGYLKNGDYENSIDYDFYVDVNVNKFEDNGKKGYVLLIHADTL